MSEPATQWRQLDPAEIPGAAATLARHAIVSAIQARGRADICLTGGSLGIAMLTPLRPLLADVDLSTVHLWWGDERHLPTGHKDRNSTQAMNALGECRAQMHPIPAPPLSADAAAAAYADALREITFDCLFLGMGPDGHIASLFPGHPSVLADGLTVVEYNSPKPPPVRVSLTLGALARTRTTVLLFAGEEKRQASTALTRGAHMEPRGSADGSYRVCTSWSAEQVKAIPARGILGEKTVVLTDHSPVR